MTRALLDRRSIAENFSLRESGQRDDALYRGFPDCERARLVEDGQCRIAQHLDRGSVPDDDLTPSRAIYPSDDRDWGGENEGARRRHDQNREHAGPALCQREGHHTDRQRRRREPNGVPVREPLKW